MYVFRAQCVGLILIGLLSQTAFLARADHIQVPSYRNMETTESRTVTTNPLSGMLIYRLEYKGNLAVAYRICFEHEEPFPFAIADFAKDILYLDRDRDGHVDEMIAPAHLKERSLTEDRPPCPPKPERP
jgi:hypothetical protein